MRCSRHPGSWATHQALDGEPLCPVCADEARATGWEPEEIANRPLESEGRSTQVVAGSVSAVSFRLEALLEESQPGFAPEDLVGHFVELNWPMGGGTLRGIVASVEPYVDSDLGPGHWVTMEAPS